MNVGIMLISFLALVALLDMMLTWVHGMPGRTGFPARSVRFWASRSRLWRG
jgi:nucleoside permease NupC